MVQLAPIARARADRCWQTPVRPFTHEPTARCYPQSPYPICLSAPSSRRAALRCTRALHCTRSTPCIVYVCATPWPRSPATGPAAPIAHDPRTAARPSPPRCASRDAARGAPRVLTPLRHQQQGGPERSTHSGASGARASLNIQSGARTTNAT